MKPAVEIKLRYRPEETPLGMPLLDAGAARVALLEEGEFNRADMAAAGSPFSDRDRSHPPDATAIVSIAGLLRTPAKSGMGSGPIHTLLHLETVPSLRDQVTAARALRQSLAKSAELSIGVFPQGFTPADEAWEDAADVVDALAWGCYPWNEVIRQGKNYWLDEIDAAGRKLKAWFPRRRRKIAYVTPFLQVWWLDQPQYADIAAQDGKPVPLDWWRAAMEKLRDDGWQPFLWGPSPLFDHAAVVDHMAVTAEVFGLMWSEPAIEVADLSTPKINA